MSDTSGKGRSAITPDRIVNARDLSRKTGRLLREVAFERRSFAIRHFGRVIGFLVPIDGREPVRRAGRLSYEVPQPRPLRDLDETHVAILGILHRNGPSVMDQLVEDRESIGPVATALCDLETGDVPLVVRPNGWYRLTPEGVRHAEALGL